MSDQRRARRRSPWSAQGMRLIGAGACVTAVALAVAACGGSSSPSTSSKPSSSGGSTTSIVVGIPPVISADAVSLAEEKGYFADAHLKVKVKILNGGAATVPALESGAINVAQSNILSEIQGASSGVHVPCFAGAFSIKTGGFIETVASAKSGITTPSQVAGKTVAVNATGGINQLDTDAWLAANGVDYHTVHYVPLEFPDMPNALAAGRVDVAASAGAPFDTMMIQAGGKLLNANPESDIPGVPEFSCWNANASWLKSHTAAVKGFLGAIQKANTFINNNKGAFRTWLKSHSTIPAKVIPSIGIPIYNTTMSAKDVTEWESAGAKYGILSPDAAKVPVNEVYQPVQ